MKKLSFILALIVLIVAGYLVYRTANPYAGLVTQIDVQSDEATVEYLQQQLGQSLSAIAASYDAGERPDLNLFMIAATNAYYLGDLAQAREIYEQYFTENAINPAAWNSYGNILYKMEDWQKAEEAYREAVALAPMEEFYMDLVRVVQKDLDRSADVEEILQEAVEKLGQTRSLMVSLAEYYESVNDCERAIAHYSVAKTLAETDEMKQAIQDDIDHIEASCVQE